MFAAFVIAPKKSSSIELAQIELAQRKRRT
jgi:hypothetical protein